MADKEGELGIGVDLEGEKDRPKSEAQLLQQYAEWARDTNPLTAWHKLHAELHEPHTKLDPNDPITDEIRKFGILDVAAITSLQGRNGRLTEEGRRRLKNCLEKNGQERNRYIEGLVTPPQAHVMGVKDVTPKELLAGHPTYMKQVPPGAGPLRRQ